MSGADGRAYAVVSPETGHTGPTGAVSFLRGVSFPLGGKRGLLGPSRGRVPFARRVLLAEKEKAVDLQLIILMWKAEGFLLASDFSEELSKTFSSQLVSTWGERCGEGGGQGAARGRQFPAQVLLYKTCSAKGRTTPLERGPLGSAHVTGQFI